MYWELKKAQCTQAKQKQMLQCCLLLFEQQAHHVLCPDHENSHPTYAQRLKQASIAYVPRSSSKAGQHTKGLISQKHRTSRWPPTCLTHEKAQEQGSHSLVVHNPQGKSPRPSWVRTLQPYNALCVPKTLQSWGGAWHVYTKPHSLANHASRKYLVAAWLLIPFVSKHSLASLLEISFCREDAPCSLKMCPCPPWNPWPSGWSPWVMKFIYFFIYLLCH